MLRPLQDFQYRYHAGRIEVQRSKKDWHVSAHDSAQAWELADYERIGHPALPALREKFGGD